MLLVTFLSLYDILFLYLTHWYVCPYAVGLVECVSLIIMGVLCVCLHFSVFIGGVCAAVWRKVHVMAGLWDYMC
jgi:hypothetical protein